MKRNKTRNSNIQAPALMSHCGGRERLHKANGVRAVLLIALAERGVSPLRIANCELRIGNDLLARLLALFERVVRFGCGEISLTGGSNLNVGNERTTASLLVR